MENGKRWHKGAGKLVSAPKVEAFLEEIAEVCKRHGFDIEHEDGNGAFVIEPLPAGGRPAGLFYAHLGADMPVE